jgi:hypothetical protein
VFANASLFHVPRAELPRVLGELHATLRPGGVLFTSNPRGDNAEAGRAISTYTFPTSLLVSLYYTLFQIVTPHSPFLLSLLLLLYSLSLSISSLPSSLILIFIYYSHLSIFLHIINLFIP